MSYNADFAEYCLLKSLVSSPLLLADLEEAKVFDRSYLRQGLELTGLNFNQKLGHLYEEALAVLLETSESVDLLARNLQVLNADRITIGEFDFLLFDKHSQEVIHLELAVKFYLAVEVAGLWQFPGPDPRDNWHRKLGRMRTHQLVLAQQPDSMAVLKRRFDVDSVLVRQLIYGCLFFPMSEETQSLPEAANPNSRKGRWLYLHEWDDYFATVESVHLIPKPLWPVELTVDLIKRLEVVSVKTLRSLAINRCTLFWLEGLMEPVFLVPDDWLTIQNIA